MPLYVKDSNNSNKQVPTADNPILKKVSHAITPRPFEIVKRPTYIMINTTGSFAFAYETGSGASIYSTGSVVYAGATAAAGGFVGPVKLDINPIAWRCTAGSISVGLTGANGETAAAGMVTFVYRSR